MLGEPTVSWQARRREATRDAILDAAWSVARERGVAALTLREVAARVGMRAPSLYTHFDSKHAIYDAMFAQAWSGYEQLMAGVEMPASPRAGLRMLAHLFFDFAVADLARHQLMNLRTVPDFRPTDEGYAPAVRVLERLRGYCESVGLSGGADVDLFTALLSGLIDQQWANDPGGTRWARLIDRAIDMYADALDLPEEPR